MAEERPLEGDDGGRKRSGATALDITGGVLGLIVFIIGVVLVVTVYQRASAMYHDIGPAVEQSTMGSENTPDDAADGSTGEDASSRPVVARPGGRPLAKVAADFGLRLVWLVLIAFLGFLIAAMGAKLAGAHRGKRT